MWSIFVPLCGCSLWGVAAAGTARPPPRAITATNINAERDMATSEDALLGNVLPGQSRGNPSEESFGTLLVGQLSQGRGGGRRCGIEPPPRLASDGARGRPIQSH